MALPSAPSSGVVLSQEARSMAQTLLAVIAEDTSSEVLCNGPAEILVKQDGARYHIDEIKFDSVEDYHAALNEFVLPYVDTVDRIDGTNILVEGQMEMPSAEPNIPPLLARVHILCPPLVKYAKVTIAKKARYEFDLDGIAGTGAMTPQMAEFLKAIAYGRLNVILSGPTGSGKTTLLQAMSRHFDQNDRIVVIEDTPELRVPLGDVVYLCSTNPRPGRPADEVVTLEWLVKAANRMRMDRVIVGECRGAEAAEFLVAANSGADGSMTTIHADNPRRALDKMLSLATKSPTAASEQTLVREIAQSVDVIVQASLVDGKHVITHIEEISRTVTGGGLISTQPLWTYNRSTGTHDVQQRPTEDLASTMQQRGVALDPSWFR